MEVATALDLGGVCSGSIFGIYPRLYRSTSSAALSSAERRYYHSLGMSGWNPNPTPSAANLGRSDFRI